MDTRQNTIELVNGSTDKKQKTVDNIYTRQLRWSNIHTQDKDTHRDSDNRHRTTVRRKETYCITHRTPETKDIRHNTPDIRYRTSDTRHNTPEMRHQAWNIRQKTTDMKHQTKNKTHDTALRHEHWTNDDILYVNLHLTKDSRFKLSHSQKMYIS